MGILELKPILEAYRHRFGGWRAFECFTTFPNGDRFDAYLPPDEIELALQNIYLRQGRISTPKVFARLIEIHPLNDGNGRMARGLATMLAAHRNEPLPDFTLLDQETIEFTTDGIAYFTKRWKILAELNQLKIENQ